MASSLAVHPDDPLLRLIRQTCYADSAAEVAELMRRSIETYRDGTEDAIQELSDRVFGAVPTGHRVGTSGGIHPVYVVQTSSHRYRCVWRELLAKGAYNHVFYADLEEEDEEEDTPAVIKITVQSDRDLRVYLLENVIHAMLYAHPGTRNLVVPMRFAFKIRKTGFPPYKLGTVMNDPGRGDLGGWIETDMANDEEMFAALTQVAWVMHQAQVAATVEHRDLKCDNILIEDLEDKTIHVTTEAVDFAFPSAGIRMLLIDFGMTRLEVGGEYVACDCMHSDRRFNPSHDMQNLLCTMHEDYQDCFQERAPRFGKWIAEQVKPLMRTVRRHWPDYEDESSEEKHKRLSYVVCTERIPGFVPEAMLETLGKTYWNKRGTKRTRATRSKASKAK